MSTLLHLAVLISTAMFQGESQGPQHEDRAARLERATLHPDFHWELAKDSFVVSDSGWVAAILSDGSALARQVSTGREIHSPRGVPVKSLCFRPGGDRPESEEIWFALGEAGVSRSALTEGAKVEALDYEFSESVDQLAFASSGSSFAWRCKASETLYVVVGVGVSMELRVKTLWGAPVRFEHTAEFPFSSRRLPPFQFARGGRSLVYTSSEGGGSATKYDQRGEKTEGIGRVFDLEKQTLTAKFRPYVCRRSRGWVLTPEGETLLFARRDAMSDWSIRELALAGASDSKVIDADARGKHFIDLYLDSTGRWLVESDREEDGVRLYDRTGEQAPITLAAKTFLGFDDSGSSGVPLIFTRTKGEYSAWTVTGELAVKHLGALSGKAHMQMKTFADGNFVGCVGWTSPEDSNRIDYHLDVMVVPTTD